MAKQPAQGQQKMRPEPVADSRVAVLRHDGNELIVAVVGHVGSGTSTVATSLAGLLGVQNLPGGPYDVEILKARDEIEKWAKGNGQALPGTNRNDLATTAAFQDLGDSMRLSSDDHSAVARALVGSIRITRASKTGIGAPGDAAIKPDGKRRAYILDSLRHPSEVELLRHVYQDSFVLIGVVCDEEERLQRLTKKYANAGRENAVQFMRRDAKANDKHGQRVSDTFHLSDFFIDNTPSRLLPNEQPNPDWDVNEQLSRLIKIITHSEIVRPSSGETAMHHAHGAAMRSACLSRQVGAALLDGAGNVLATGSNEVPRAGGGVYGESFERLADDHRCAFQKVAGGPFCSNTRQQNLMVERLIEEIPELRAADAIRKQTLTLEIRGSGVGDLLEFSRAVHAEMDAILSAGRSGESTAGTRLFVTTFPCHYCARHIVSAGVEEVQYIEPYPKSQALSLHSDAIQTVAASWTPPSKGGTKVLFRPFVGVAPRMYRRAFLKDRDLKNSTTGMLDIGQPKWGTPWLSRTASYVELEAVLAKAPT